MAQTRSSISARHFPHDASLYVIPVDVPQILPERMFSRQLWPAARVCAHHRDWDASDSGRVNCSEPIHLDYNALIVQVGNGTTWPTALTETALFLLVRF